MQIGIRTDADSPLSTRLSQLMALRLLVLTIFLGVTATLYSGGLPAGGFSSRVALVAHPHVIWLDAAFVFHPLRPLGNFARSHDEPAEEAFWEHKDLLKQH